MHKNAAGFTVTLSTEDLAQTNKINFLLPLLHMCDRINQQWHHHEHNLQAPQMLLAMKKRNTSCSATFGRTNLDFASSSHKKKAFTPLESLNMFYFMLSICSETDDFPQSTASFLCFTIFSVLCILFPRYINVFLGDHYDCSECHRLTVYCIPNTLRSVLMD